MASKRRTFLKCAAALAAGAAVGSAASPAPWDALRQLERREHSPPDLPHPPAGPLEHVDTVSAAGAFGTGIRVLTSNGKPMLVRANPENPLGRCGLAPEDLEQVRALARPGRLSVPLLRNAEGRLEPVAWSKALDLLAARFGEARGEVLIVTPARKSCGRDVAAALCAELGAVHAAMPSEAATAARAAALMGLAGTPGYDLDNARGLVLLGADAFGSMPASPHLRRAWATARGRGTKSRAMYFGPERGASAALCDTWIPLAAGSEATAALGLCWHLDALGLARCEASDLAEFLQLIRTRFTPELVRSATGLPPEALENAARVLAEGGVLIAGSASGSGADDAAILAGLAANALAGRLNRPGGVILVEGLPATPGTPAPVDDLLSILRAVAQGERPAPKALLLVEADPLAELPDGVLTARALSRIGFKACFADRLTASAALCDLVLPAAMPLERQEDVRTPYGLALACLGLARPLLRPLGDCRHPADVLLEAASRLGLPTAGHTHQARLRALSLALEGEGGFVARGVEPWKVLAGEGRPAPEADLWRELQAGRLWCGPRIRQGVHTLGAALLAGVAGPAASDLERPLTLVVRPAPEQVIQDGLGGAIPSVRLNAATAKSLRLRDGVRATLKGHSGSAAVRVALDESVMDGHAVLTPAREQLPAIRAAMDSRPAEIGAARRWDACRATLEPA
ncbi:molybdopterin-dependent oxidoreductase [Fundidesulfovibrio agrisoli]|uniref:molybdopterin-dependent oxidoreductase n=1 Tax=Fundidesulfovibrio agrisoli TaxID=2922717 RepID=UPI001FAB79CA|nr:molybdopterin-dependent oxidoreductase [Fundidesulfovibrio agrisoli]